MKYLVIIENAGPNYSAYVPDLPGCITTGATIDEVRANIAEAIEFHLDGMREDGDPIPPPATVAEYVEPKVA
jgi:predicted RNase H-like HicB family nuclease